MTDKIVMNFFKNTSSNDRLGLVSMKTAMVPRESETGRKGAIRTKARAKTGTGGHSFVFSA